MSSCKSVVTSYHEPPINTIGGGVPQIFCYFHPNPWGHDPIWRFAYFSNGWFNHQLVSHEWPFGRDPTTRSLGTCWRFLGFSSCGRRLSQWMRHPKLSSKFLWRFRSQLLQKGRQWQSSGIILGPILGDQTMQMYGSLEGFPQKNMCIVLFDVIQWPLILFQISGRNPRY